MLYIRHTVGSRLFYESNDYQISPITNGWDVSFNVDQETAETLLKFKDELNIFHVQSDQEKTWFYSSEGNVQYIEGENQMVITVDHKTVYPV